MASFLLPRLRGRGVTDPIAPDVVMDIPLRRSKRAHRSAISDDYIVYLQEHEYDVGDVSYPTTYKKAIVSPQSNF